MCSMLSNGCVQRRFRGSRVGRPELRAGRRHCGEQVLPESQPAAERLTTAIRLASAPPAEAMDRVALVNEHFDEASPVAAAVDRQKRSTWPHSGGMTAAPPLR